MYCKLWNNNMHDRVLALYELTNQQVMWAGTPQCDKMAPQKHHVCLQKRKSAACWLTDKSTMSASNLSSASFVVYFFDI